MASYLKNGYVVAAAALIVLEAGVQWWSVHSIPVATVSHVLRLNLPDPKRTDATHATDALERPEGFEELDLDEVAAETLSYDVGRRVRYRSDGMAMDVHYTEYRAGNQHYVIDLYSHEPEVCMAAAGASLIADNGNRMFTIGGQSFRIRCLTFNDPPSSRRIHIYKLIWVPPGFDTKADPTYSAMKEVWIKRAFTRTPWPPARLILAGVRGAENEDSAWKFFEDTVLKRAELVAVP